MTITDSAGFSVSSAALFIVVAFAPTISSFTASPGSVVAGTTTTFTVGASGGAGVRSYSYRGLPAGCSNADEPTFACTPTSTGTYTIGVTVSDANGETAQSNATLTVTAPTSTFSPSSAYGLLGVGLLVGLLVGGVVVFLMTRGRPVAARPAAAPAPWKETSSDSQDPPSRGGGS